MYFKISKMQFLQQIVQNLFTFIWFESSSPIFLMIPKERNAKQGLFGLHLDQIKSKDAEGKIKHMPFKRIAM